jgi:hypothetical protein
VSYEYGGKKWVGQPNMLSAIRDDRTLYSAILMDLKKQDLPGAKAATVIVKETIEGAGETAIGETAAPEVIIGQG